MLAGVSVKERFERFGGVSFLVVRAWSKLVSLFFLFFISINGYFFIYHSVRAIQKDSVLGEYVFNFLFPLVLLFTIVSMWIEVSIIAGKRSKLVGARTYIYLVYFFVFVAVNYSAGAGEVVIPSYISLHEIQELLLDFGLFEVESLFDQLFKFLYLILVVSLYARALRLGYAYGAVVAKIIALLSAYYILCMFFAVNWILLYLDDSGSIHGDFSSPYDAVYFSFVTMTTLGYGDYYPISDAAKTLAIFEVVIGVFFSSLLIGLAIGYTMSVVNLSGKSDREDEKKFTELPPSPRS